MPKILVGFAAVLSLIGTGCGDEPHRPRRPNVLLIVADDLGYSDVGGFGGEIPTPTLDRLAAEGVTLADFHATPNCAPTRAALLSGVDYHRAGLGTMTEVAAPNQQGKPGYEGHLNDRVTTIAELLRDAGYHTYMSGKWHLGFKDPSMRPFARGFEQTFALLAGGASHWQDNTPLIPGKPSPYARNGELLDELPDGFYSTMAYTEQMIEFIQADRSDDKPFFAYLAYTAPHNPLHAPEETIEKYRGRYDEGWDALRERRMDRQRELGLIPDGAPVGARPEWILAWDELTDEQRQQRARDMEIYAAMVDLLDQAIGRVLDNLRESGQYDNTLIVFLSDNGASRTTILDYAALGGEVAEFLEGFDNSLDNRGLPGSSTDIGPGWAYAANAPFRLMKGYVSQGGMQVPALVKLPGAMDTPPVRSRTPSPTLSTSCRRYSRPLESSIPRPTGGGRSTRSTDSPGCRSSKVVPTSGLRAGRWGSSFTDSAPTGEGNGKFCAWPSRTEPASGSCTAWTRTPARYATWPVSIQTKSPS